MPASRTPQDSLVIRSHKTNPKTPRQQNTACAPCRRRRVKCDRKDATNEVDNRPTCTECFQRSFICVDDIREVKPAKLLRRGRKIQELEKIYARTSDNLALSPSPFLEQRAPSPPSAVPQLQMPFFDSAFYRRFHIQRPVVDPTEFIHRFKQFVHEGVPLGTYGELIAKLLATWAASYGVNERGEEEPHEGFVSVERRREATNIMVRELLATIDKYSVMRNISWDGVRVLLLLMPLTEEVQPEVDRANMYQSTVLQVYTLSNLGDIPSYGAAGGPINQMVRARIFWYGHVHEGLTNGLKGRKLIFDQDDVEAFKTPLTTRDYNNSLSKSNVTSSYTYRYATAPIRLSAACRLTNSVLTGPKAERSETVDKDGLHLVWSRLAESWDEFEELRNITLSSHVSRGEETDRFVSGWQIFIFEAYNIIREKLYERILRKRGANMSNGAYVADTEYSTTSEAQLRDLVHLHEIAESKCHDVASKVMVLIKRHLDTPFFEYDASLCRDGVYYAGERMADDPDSDEQVNVCLMALQQMRWAYSKGRERTEKLKARWAARRLPGESHADHRRRAEPLSGASGIGPGHLNMTYSMYDGVLDFPPQDGFDAMQLPTIPPVSGMGMYGAARGSSPNMPGSEVGFNGGFMNGSQSHISTNPMVSNAYGSGPSSPSGSDHSYSQHSLEGQPPVTLMSGRAVVTPPPNGFHAIRIKTNDSPPSFQPSRHQQQATYDTSYSSTVASSSSTRSDAKRPPIRTTSSLSPPQSGSHTRTHSLHSPTAYGYGDQSSEIYGISGVPQPQASSSSYDRHYMDPVAMLYRQPPSSSTGPLPPLNELAGIHESFLGGGSGYQHETLPSLSTGPHSYMSSYSNHSSSHLHPYATPPELLDYSGVTSLVPRQNGISSSSTVSSSASSPYTNPGSARYPHSSLHPLTIPNHGHFSDGGSSAGPHKNSPLHDPTFGFPLP